jgi:hypothetical protein
LKVKDIIQWNPVKILKHSSDSLLQRYVGISRSHYYYLLITNINIFSFNFRWPISALLESKEFPEQPTEEIRNDDWSDRRMLQ